MELEVEVLFSQSPQLAEVTKKTTLWPEIIFRGKNIDIQFLECALEKFIGERQTQP